MKINNIIKFKLTLLYIKKKNKLFLLLTNLKYILKESIEVFINIICTVAMIFYNGPMLNGRTRIIAM